MPASCPWLCFALHLSRQAFSRRMACVAIGILRLHGFDSRIVSTGPNCPYDFPTGTP
ncbi:hypothetical protein BS78_04G055300 [Paspalum vaginatum]|nr:hypothetical protein BS78_04G055300 [Paspalum vaginatum]